MMLTINNNGKLAVYSTGSYTQLEIDSIHGLFDAMQDYDVDFISPTLLHPHQHTDDKTTLEILKQFQLVRLQTILTPRFLKGIPTA